MAAKTPAQAVRSRRRANEPHLEDPGNIGRATGLEMPRFSKGGEEFDNLSEYFPTTGKATRGQRKSDVSATSSADMDVADSSGLEVTEHLLQRSAKSAYKPPPHSRSPLKANMRGTPRRPSSIGPMSSAQSNATAPQAVMHTPGAIPKLDLHIGPSPRRPYTPRMNGDSRSSGDFSASASPERGRRDSAPIRDQDTELDDTTVNVGDFYNEPQAPAGTTMDNDTLADMQPNRTFDDSVMGSGGSARKSRRNEGLHSSARRTRQSGSSFDLRQSSAVDEEASIVEDAPLLQDQESHEEEDEPVEILEEHQEVEPESDPEATTAPSPAKNKRGRPAKGQSAELPNSKRVRKNPVKETIEIPQQRRKQVLAAKDPNKKIVVSNGTKSNVRVRQQTPYEDDESSYTNRFGRLVYRPLAHWKNERVNLQPIETEDGAFVYSMTDLVRMDDVTPKKRVHNHTDDAKTHRRRRRKVQTVFEDSDPEDGEEPWETNDGLIGGPVKMWDPELETAEETRYQELAYAASRIDAQENAEGSFRFAKTLTMPFFGSGIVELPPGGIKRTKNSRKMQMMFFVHFGKVTVEIAGTRFTISKGGVFQIPRGNNYSIANETEHEAKLFFAQGYEVKVGADDVRTGELPLAE